MDMIYYWTGFEKGNEGPVPPEEAACGSPLQQHHLSAVHLRRLILIIPVV
jgi:hypothetical protein